MSGLVIIPAYNEEATVAQVLHHLRSLLPAGVDVLVVNDCSRDQTAVQAARAGVMVCSLPCNLGYAKALKTGLKYGLSRGYDWFAFMDADGQHRPEDMLRLIGHYESHSADLVIGSRWLDKEIRADSGRRIGMIFFSWLTRKLTGEHLTDTTSGMKIMNRQVAGALLAQNFGDFHSEVIVYLHDRGFKIAESPIVVHERRAGTSMYSFKDAVIYPVKNLILIGIFKLNSWALKKVAQP